MSNAEKDLFFERMEDLELALTYDDVRLRTRSGQFAPVPAAEIDITSRFTENVELKVPIVSAAMDTVTDSGMAIEMAKLGGLGVIHAAMTIDEQYKEVRRVKLAANGLIDTPITVRDTDTLETVEAMRRARRFEFKTFTVEDNTGKLVGVLTGKDFEYPESLATTVGEAMTPMGQVEYAAVGTTLQEAYDRMKTLKINTLPILNEDGSTGGLYLWSDVKRNIREAGKYNVDANQQLVVAAAVSTGKDTLDRVEQLKKYADVIVIDTADGDSYYAFQTLKAIKKTFPDVEVMVGNISDGASARELAEAGANGIKVGQGPGSICSTRRETGIGMPQVTAIYDAVHALGNDYAHIPVCADGGVKDHGDFPIAIGAGARTVMVGKMLAGTKQAPGEIVTKRDGTLAKLYRGMGSASALRDNQTSRERYDTNGTDILAEGEESYIPFDGELNKVLGLCISGLRKGMSYVKSPDIETHRREALFKRISPAGYQESMPHDVEVIK